MNCLWAFYFKESVSCAVSAIPELQVFHGIFVGLIEPWGGNSSFTKFPLKTKIRDFSS